MNVDIADAAELEEQTAWQQTKMHQWLAESYVTLSVEKLEKSATASEGHHAFDHSENERRRNRQWSTMYTQSTADGTTANQTPELLPVHLYRQSETRDEAHMDFPNAYSVLNWSELAEMHRTASSKKKKKKVSTSTITHNLRLPKLLTSKTALY